MESRPSLLFFYSPSDGRSRRVEALLAQALQRNKNHDTFVVRRIDVTRHPQVATRFRIEQLPVLCVVEEGASSAASSPRAARRRSGTRSARG